MDGKWWEEKFFSNIEKSESCWLWKGQLRGGYGRVTFKGRYYSAHRILFEKEVGVIPMGMVTDHLCRVRNCVNVKHLEVVTQKENILRGVGRPALMKRLKKCQKGHEFSFNSKRRSRFCHTCKKENDAVYYINNAEKIKERSRAWLRLDINKAKRRETYRKRQLKRKERLTQSAVPL